jgi:hypothetical protein
MPFSTEVQRNQRDVKLTACASLIQTHGNDGLMGKPPNHRSIVRCGVFPGLNASCI